MGRRGGPWDDMARGLPLDGSRRCWAGRLSSRRCHVLVADVPRTEDSWRLLRRSSLLPMDGDHDGSWHLRNLLALLPLFRFSLPASLAASVGGCLCFPMQLLQLSLQSSLRGGRWSRRRRSRKRRSRRSARRDGYRGCGGDRKCGRRRLLPFPLSPPLPLPPCPRPFLRSIGTWCRWCGSQKRLESRGRLDGRGRLRERSGRRGEGADDAFRASLSRASGAELPVIFSRRSTGRGIHDE